MERNTAKRTLEKLLSVCICLCMLGAMLPAQVSVSYTHLTLPTKA